MRRVLTQYNALWKALQSSNLNYASVKDMACAMMETIVSMRTEDLFQHLWNYVSDICGYQGLQLPRQRYIRAKSGGHPVNETEQVHDFYQREVLFAVLDKTADEIKERFKENDMEALTALNSIMTTPAKSIEESHLDLICKNYSICKEELTAELSVFKKMLENKSNFEH